MSNTTHGQRGRLHGLLRALAAVVTLPPAILHEATHAALAAPWAHELSVVVEPASARAAVGIDWRPDVPQWAVVTAHYGPLLVGAAVGLLGTGWLVAGHQPESARAWLLSGMLAVWWVIYTAPSQDDRRLPPETDPDATGDYNGP